MAFFLLASKRGVLLALAGCFTWGLAACSSTNLSGDIPPPQLPAGGAPPPRQQADASLIRQGDRLQLFVMEDPSFNQMLVVRERGDVIMAPFGRIDVAGLSVEAAERRIRELLQRDQLKKATVILDRVSRGQAAAATAPDPARDQSQKILVYMTGKVARPGQHVITLPEGAPVGVYEGILITGGLDRFGDEQKVHVMRAGADGARSKIPVNLRNIRQGKAQDLPLGHGDIVVVPERVFGF